jgi:hypothetical protein
MNKPPVDVAEQEVLGPAPGLTTGNFWFKGSEMRMFGPKVWRVRQTIMAKK